MKEILKKLAAREELTREEASSSMHKLFSDSTQDLEIASFLSLLSCRYPTVDELLGYRDALIEKALKIEEVEDDLIDLCGTGGDGKNTFNISTLSALVVGAMGYKVAKHGNYSASSRFGSSNLLEALGVRFPKSREEVLEEISDHGVAFLHAPFFHPALKKMKPIREKLGFRTIFNYLGPLLNPVTLKAQLIGVSSIDLIGLFADAGKELPHIVGVVTSEEGYDEIVLATKGYLKCNGELKEVACRNFGIISPPEKRSLNGADTLDKLIDEAKEFLRGNGEEEKVDVVAVNAALSVSLLNGGENLTLLYQKAKECIKSGEPYRKLEEITR